MFLLPTLWVVMESGRSSGCVLTMAGSWKSFALACALLTYAPSLKRASAVISGAGLSRILFAGGVACRLHPHSLGTEFTTVLLIIQSLIEVETREFWSNLVAEVRASRMMKSRGSELSTSNMSLVALGLSFSLYC